MSIWIWVAFAVVLVGLYLSWTAGRLDRLHARIDAARAGLDAQLLRRASATLELSTSTLLDPAASVVRPAALRASRTSGISRTESGSENGPGVPPGPRESRGAQGSSNSPALCASTSAARATEAGSVVTISYTASRSAATTDQS